MKVKLTIELDYDLNELGITEWDNYKDITDSLEDRVYEDLAELMRGDRLYYWSEIETISDDIDEELTTCPKCEETFLYWQIDNHNSTKHSGSEN